MSNEVIEAIESIGHSFDAFRKQNDQRLATLEERLEIKEALSDRPRASSNGGRDGFTKDHHEHKQAFCDWLRKPKDGPTQRRLDEAQTEVQRKAQHEGKAVTVASPSGGGYAVPEILDSQIESRVNLLNPFRSLVRVVQVGSRDWKALVSSNDLASGWVGEGDARSETGTSRLFERAPTFGEVYAYPKCSSEAMDDIFFDVGAWLTEEAGDAFAVAEATAIVSGNGSKKPTGFLNSVSALDDSASPERAAGTVQYLSLTNSPQKLNADDLITMSLSIKERYTLDGSAVAWVMRRSTAATVRKLKDTYGQYLWQPSLQAGQPNMLLGYPVQLTDAMPTVAADQYPIAFANWRRAYILCDRVASMRITHDDNITTPGQHKFYLRRVLGGTTYNDQAIKVLKIAD